MDEKQEAFHTNRNSVVSNEEIIHRQNSMTQLIVGRCFIACYRSNYNMSYIAVNFAVWIVCIVPKVPGMHQIRLFGLNTTVGIDDVKKE